jgi:hypothetical protein
MKEDYRVRHQRLADRAANILATHTYTRLTPLGSIGEIWRCKRPDSTCYGFDIMITRFGIAVVGDIGGLTFNVGATYGTGFLAGDDVDYYIHSKLEQHCKTTEIDEDYFNETRNSLASHWLDNVLTDEVLPEQGATDHDSYRSILHDWVDALQDKFDVCSKQWDALDAIAEMLDDNCFSVSECHETLADCAHKLGRSYDYDHDFEKPAESLINQLYMIRHAAIQIQAIKYPPPGSAILAYSSEGEPA